MQFKAAAWQLLHLRLSKTRLVFDLSECTFSIKKMKMYAIHIIMKNGREL